MYRHRHGTWLLRSTSDTREHRRELRKGRIDRGLLRAGSVRARVMTVREGHCQSRVLRAEAATLTPNCVRSPDISNIAASFDNPRGSLTRWAPQRQPEARAKAVGQMVVEREGALVVVRYVQGDGQAESKAARLLARFVRPIEGLQHRLLFCVGDAGT